MDHGNLFIYFRLRENHANEMFCPHTTPRARSLAEGRSVPPAFWCEGDFLLVLFFSKKKSTLIFDMCEVETIMRSDIGGVSLDTVQLLDKLFFRRLSR
jgi:hypothetical protein